MYLAPPLIVDFSDDTHCPIAIKYILFLFSFMMSSLSRYLIRLSPTFTVWSIYFLHIYLIFRYVYFLESRGWVLQISYYTQNFFCMSEVLHKTTIEFPRKLSQVTIFLVLLEQTQDYVYLWGITNKVCCTIAMMIVVAPSLVDMFLMRCCWSFLCSCINVIVFFVFVGSHASTFIIIIIIIIYCLASYYSSFPRFYVQV